MIALLGLEPHPEGGHYRQTFRAPDQPRGASTAIYFLLKAGERSHWHKVDADELWFWHAGAPLELRIGDAVVTLGPDDPQALVPAGAWQAAEAKAGWTLVSCVVVPGFEFSGFTLAPEGWEPGT